MVWVKSEMQTLEQNTKEYTTIVKAILTYSDGSSRIDEGEIGSLRHRGFMNNNLRPINISLPIFVKDFECIQHFYQAVHPLKGSLTFRVSDKNV